MPSIDKSPPRPQLKELVVEASQALARLDAGRLEELALSCQALNREIATAGGSDRARLTFEARDAAADMAVFGRVLEVTRANLQVMNRLRELRQGRIEYSVAQVCGPTQVENGYGDN